MHCNINNRLISVPRRDAETAEFIEDLQAQIRELVKTNEALKNKVFLTPIIIEVFVACSTFI